MDSIEKKKKKQSTCSLAEGFAINTDYNPATWQTTVISFIILDIFISTQCHSEKQQNLKRRTGAVNLTKQNVTNTLLIVGDSETSHSINTKFKLQLHSRDNTILFVQQL